MKSIRQLLILTLLFATSSVNAQYVTISYSTPPPIMLCGGMTAYISANISQLPVANWRYEWYRHVNNCGYQNFTQSIVSTTQGLTIWESGIYFCVVYDDAQGISYSTTGYEVLVLPSGPTLVRAPQPTGSNCAATSVNLCIPDIPAIQGNYTLPSVQWYKDNLGIPNATGLNYTATASGYYTYTFTSTCGLSISESIYIFVGTALPNQITAGGPTSYCAGGSVVLSAPANPGLMYQWQRNSVNISGANSSTYTVTNTSGTYSCIISSATCSGIASNTIQVTVHGFYMVFNSLAASYTLASPPVTLTATPAGGTFSGPGVSGNIFTPSIAGSGTHVISYTYTDQYGCTGTLSRTTTVCGPPPTPASITGSSTPCANSTNVAYSCPGVANATSYTWAVPASATIVSGQGSNNISVNFGSTFTSGTITVTANKTNCGSSAPQTKNVYGKPAQPGTISGQSSVCAGTVNVSYSIAAVNGATSYNWAMTSGATIVSGQGTTQVLVNFGSTFTSGTISVTASNNCGISNIKSAQIISKPPTPGTISGPTGFCAYQQGVVYSVAAVTGATTYTWLVPNGASIVSGQGTNSITVNFGNKSGFIKVAAGNACGSSSNKQLKVDKNCRVSQNQFTSDQATIYPNPSSADFILKTGITDDSAMELLIFDSTGKLIFSNTVHGSEYLLQGSLLSPGIYRVVLNTNEQSQSITIVKNE